MEQGKRSTAAAWINRIRVWAMVCPGLLWTVAFFVVPISVMAYYSFFRREGGALGADPTLYNYETFFSKSYHVQALFNSLEVTAMTTVVSVLLAYPFAYILAFKLPPRWQRFAVLLAILPFWTSYIVRSYSWVLVLSGPGIISQVLQATGIADGPISLAHQRAATVIGFAHFFTMLLTLTIYVNLVQISPNYAKAAADLGASRFQILLRILLPLSVPGIMIGAFLTFVLALGDYVTPQILGGNKELVLPQTIMLQIRRYSDFPFASAMSFVLMSVVTVVGLACSRWLRMDRV